MKPAEQDLGTAEASPGPPVHDHVDAKADREVAKSHYCYRWRAPGT